MAVRKTVKLALPPSAGWGVWEREGGAAARELGARMSEDGLGESVERWARVGNAPLRNGNNKEKYIFYMKKSASCGERWARRDLFTLALRKTTCAHQRAEEKKSISTPEMVVEAAAGRGRGPGAQFYPVLPGNA